LTDALYIHICVKHFGMANIKIKDPELYTNLSIRGAYKRVSFINGECFLLSDMAWLILLVGICKY